MRNVKEFITIICFGLLPVSIFGQGIQLKAYVSKNAVTSEEHFSYSVEASGSSTDLPDIAAPLFKDFYILSGPSQSTNIQFVNGKSSATKTYSYY